MKELWIILLTVTGHLITFIKKIRLLNMKFAQNIHPIFFLIIATILEVCGDAIIRTSIYTQTGLARLAYMLVGACLLFGYGFSLNLAPVEFGKVVGLYIATLFIVWQIINYFTFRTPITTPVLLGGSLVVIGGLIITFWGSK